MRIAPLAVDRRSETSVLVEANLGLVQQAAATMAGRVPRHVSWDDLVSAGMLGLTEAARAYDASRGVPFECFALARIRGALLDELRGLDWASRSVRARARAVDAATDVLAAQLGRVPTAAEIAERLEISPAAVARVAHDLQRASIVHYDAMAAAGDGGASDDVLPATGRAPDEIVLERERRGELWDAVSALPERLRHVVVGSFVAERRLRDIAEDLGVTESRVSQMRTEAIALLRRGMADAPADLDLREPAPGRRPRRQSDLVGAGSVLAVA